MGFLASVVWYNICMATLLTKSFFKFFFGFFAIVALGIMGIMFIGTLEFEEDNQAQIDATAEAAPAGSAGVDR